MPSYLLVFATLISLLSSPLAAASDTTLQRIEKNKLLKIGYRESSPPFSFLAEDGRPQGYSIELCQLVASDILRHMKFDALGVEWVKVDAQNRFDALQRGDIDLLCGNTTQTLSRREQFDFSLMTFVDGAGLLYRAGEKPQSLEQMRGQRFAVVAGTTTEKVLDRLVSGSKLGASLVRVKDHDMAIKALEGGDASAYAADRTVLISTALAKGSGKTLELADVQFSYEPYGLVMRRDADFRLLVDRTLARLYSNGEIEMIMGRWFATVGHLTDAIKAMIELNALPE